MRRGWMVLLLVSGPVWCADFTLTCKLPFASIAPATDAHAACGIDGSEKGGVAAPAAKILEDHAKNDLCEPFATPVTVDFTILRNMQAQSPSKTPLEAKTNPSRASLKNFFTLGQQKIGEGTVVRLMAFIKEAHISDCTDSASAGEEVNCKLLGMDHNDFHIPLLDPSKPNAQQQDECTSVTAEMIPHFRPAAWNSIDLKTPTMNPVRVTGPLFFDDSHTVCTFSSSGAVTKRETPARSSLWEIHPVYQLEVCAGTSAAQCDVSSASTTMWTPYDQWVTTHASQTTASGKSQRSACPNGTSTGSKTKGK